MTDEEFRASVARVADQVTLCGARIGVLENRMDRYDSGAKRLGEEANEVRATLDVIRDQNARQLLELEIAKADRAATIRTVKWLAGAGAVVFPSLMWLIQHSGTR